eukprot:CAMPEP_0185265096 /NCGR_PEP_ID=MMETSP1359-20130426/26343_1 /TAXON_ID=552665 /ORGANISM="Bigelowiella longifila, Strain CCMP242" /LENGTH=260 /DNA_ID=CAMNT_0027854167 /DNA_START=163 /DNA_END=946 /DNA_ORIENTATION=-
MGLEDSIQQQDMLARTNLDVCLVSGDAIWDVVRHHGFGDMVKSFDDLYVALDYTLCILLLIEVLIRGIAVQGRFFRECVNWIDMSVLALLLATNVVMHTRLDRYLGRNKARNIWVLCIYAVRYVAQVVRLCMVWHESRIQARLHQTANELKVRMPGVEEVSGEITGEGSFIDLQEKGRHPIYHSFDNRDDPRGVLLEKYSKRPAVQTRISKTSEDPKALNGVSASSYERRKSAVDVMAVAFDITPPGSPSGSSWGDALSS